MSMLRSGARDLAEIEYQLLCAWSRVTGPCIHFSSVC